MLLVKSNMFVSLHLYTLQRQHNRLTALFWTSAAYIHKYAYVWCTCTCMTTHTHTHTEQELQGEEYSNSTGQDKWSHWKRRGMHVILYNGSCFAIWLKLSRDMHEYVYTVYLDSILSAYVRTCEKAKKFKPKGQTVTIFLEPLKKKRHYATHC